MKTRLTNVREVFFVAQPSKGLNGTTILGDTSAYNYTSDGWSLFAETTSASKGLIHVNGSRMQMSEANATSFTKTCTNVTVFSVAATGNTSIGLLGSDRYLMNKSGGSRLGEVIAFSKVLTQPERTALSRHLVKKWIRGAEQQDAATVTLCKKTSKLIVPTGRTVRIGRLATAGAFVKAGGGRLEIAELTPSNTVITVEAGSVGLAAAAVRTDAPATDPYIWLDATSNSFETVSGTTDGETHVSSWKDCRSGVAREATAIGCTSGVTPTLVENAVGKKRVVDLGLGGSTEYGTQAFFALPTWKSGGDADTYAGFVVYRRTTTAVHWPMFASDNMDMTLEVGGGALLSSKYAATLPPAARWTINGVVVNPWEQQPAMNQTDDFCVIAFKSASPLIVNAMAKDRYASTMARRCGNCQIGEFITYHRPLTEDEFRQTEAYLMSKWLSADHPATENEVSLDFDSSAPIEIVAERDMEVATLSGGNGLLAKDGVSDVSASVELPSVAEGITVREGSLDLAVNVASRAVFHLDASDLASFTYQENESSGSVVTNVTYWYDVRRNGRYARSAYDQSKATAVAIANPVRRSVETAPGVFRTLVDFGPRKNKADKVSVEEASAMLFNENIDTCREAIIVYADHGTAYNAILAGKGNTAYNDVQAWNVNDANYMRDGMSVLMSKNYAYRGFRDGEAFVRMDGEKIDPFKQTLSGFHVLTFVPGADTSSNGVTRVGAIAYDRACSAGGAYVAELLVFDQVLSDGERQTLENHLLKKWMNIDSEKSVAFATGAISLGADASLGFEPGGLRSSSVEVEGLAALCADSLAFADGADFICSVLNPSSVAALAVEGAVTLPETMTIVLKPGDADRLHTGEYTLLTASEGITGTPLFSIDDSALTRRLSSPHVSVCGNRLVLRHGSGLMIYLR